MTDMNKKSGNKNKVKKDNITVILKYKAIKPDII